VKERRKGVGRRVRVGVGVTVADVRARPSSRLYACERAGTQNIAVRHDELEHASRFASLLRSHGRMTISVRADLNVSIPFQTELPLPTTLPDARRSTFRRMNGSSWYGSKNLRRSGKGARREEKRRTRRRTEKLASKSWSWSLD
jgi:hypothetical protein